MTVFRELTREAHAYNRASEDKDQEPRLRISEALLKSDENGLLDFVRLAVSLTRKTILGHGTLSLAKPGRVGWVVRQENVTQKCHHYRDGPFNNEDPPLPEIVREAHQPIYSSISKTYPCGISTGSVHVTDNPGGDETSEGGRQGVPAVEDGNPGGQLGFGVPRGQEEDATGEVWSLNNAHEEAKNY